ncbi:MAG: tetratricopeptide repeat protein [Acidobacteria bacterium]|nr:tetratricopeptide repeat protein [Acidobacteriota bacterium]
MTLPGGAAVQGAAPQTAAAVLADADALYRDREHPASALAAAKVWADRLAARADDFEAAWKLARARYWLGTNGPGTADEKKRVLEQGIAAARAAMAMRPEAVEGHFWMAANMGALADAHGLRQGMKYRTPIKAALEKALAIQPAYLDGSPDRALGRWYFKVPGLFGGDVRKSETHLRKALTYKPDSVISLLFLAETLIELDRRTEARATLQAAIDATPDAEWAPEDARFKAQARTLLATLRR